MILRRIEQMFYEWVLPIGVGRIDRFVWYIPDLIYVGSAKWKPHVYWIYMDDPRAVTHNVIEYDDGSLLV